MSNTGSVAATPRADGWRAAAACRGEDPELFFPKGTDGPSLRVIASAKAICYRCPSLAACRTWALDTRMPDGIWGALTERERRRIHRQSAVIAAGPPPPLPDTLEELWEQRTRPLPGGHLGWVGYAPVKWQGTNLTPGQIGFRITRGRPSAGRVLRSCPQDGCVLPAHVADNSERQRCGSRGGYTKHLREGTEVCGPCRKANADRQLKNAASSRLVAS